jgi:hypothetical protein
MFVWIAAERQRQRLIGEPYQFDDRMLADIALSRGAYIDFSVASLQQSWWFIGDSRRGCSCHVYQLRTHGRADSCSSCLS